MATPTLYDFTTYEIEPDTTSPSVPYPTVPADGLVIIIVSNDGSAITSGATSGWQLMTSVGSNPRLFAYARYFGSGTSAGNFSWTWSSSESGSAHIYIFTGTYASNTEGDDCLAGGETSGTSTGPNPLSFTPTFSTGGSASRDYYWIAACAHSSGQTVSAAPSGYTDLNVTNDATGTAHAALATARKTSTASSEDAGAFTLTSSVGWAAMVIAIRPFDPSQNVSPTGIASLESFGTATILATIAPPGIASLEAFGTNQINSALSPTGIASLEAFGSHTIAPGSVTILPTGIASLEAFGTLSAINVQIVSVTGIASLEAFGTLAIAPGSFTILPTGIASLEAFGATAVGSIISPTGISSLEAFGTLQVNSALTLTGIASLEAFGAAVIAAVISPSGIASLEAFGTLIAKNVVIILPTGIDSLEAFGTATLRATISPTGIATEEAVGTSVLLRIVSPTGISSLEAFGTLSIAAGAVTILPTGIASLEEFGVLVALLSITDGSKPPPGFSVLSLPMTPGGSPFTLTPPSGGSGSSLWLPPGAGR